MRRFTIDDRLDRLLFSYRLPAKSKFQRVVTECQKCLETFCNVSDYRIQIIEPSAAYQLIMESIHKPNEMPFVSDLINVREFVNEVLGQAASDFQTAEAASMAELLGCSEDDVKGLEEVCR